jgi:hypothetical protein
MTWLKKVAIFYDLVVFLPEAVINSYHAYLMMRIV